MNKELKEKIIQVCDAKIQKKGANVGLSFYAFFKNKNDDSDRLMQAATWWIQTHKLDHFEKNCEDQTDGSRGTLGNHCLGVVS